MESLIVATDIVDLGSVCAMIVGLIYSTTLDFCDVCLLKKEKEKKKRASQNRYTSREFL